MEPLFGKSKYINGKSPGKTPTQPGVMLPFLGKKKKEPAPLGALNHRQSYDRTVNLKVTHTHAMLFPTSDIPTSAINATRYFEQNFEHTTKFKQGKWDGKRSLGVFRWDSDEKEFVFPIGLLPKVIEACNRVGVRVHETSTLRHKPPPHMKPIERGLLHGGIELRDYQNDMADAFIDFSLYQDVDGLKSVRSISLGEAEKKFSEVGDITRYRVPGCGLIWSATGSGKTVASASIIGRLGVKALFMVYGNDLVRQTWDNFQHYLGSWLLGHGETVGICAEGDFNPGFVTVAGSSTLAAMLTGRERAVSDAQNSVRRFQRTLSDATDNTLKGKAGKDHREILHQLRQLLGRWNALIPGNIPNAREVARQIEALDFEGLVFADEYAVAPVIEGGEITEEGMLHEDWLSLLQSALRSIERFPGRYSEVSRRREELLEYLQTVDLLIADEAHGAAASGAYSVIQNCPAYYRVGMSGTPLDRADGANLKVLAAFGEVSARVTNAQMREAGIIPDATIRMISVPGHLSMPRGYIWNDLYTEGLVLWDWRNDDACERIQRVYDAGGKTMVLFKAIEHGEVLSALLEDRGISFVCLDGKSKSKERHKALLNFNEGLLRVLVASAIFGTGIDIPEGFDLLVNIAGGKGKSGKERGGIPVLQALGRGLRGGGEKKLEVVDYMDEHHRTLYKHSCGRLRIYREQECFEIIEEKSNFVL